MALDWNITITILSGVIGFLLFVLTYRYARRELKVAPRNTQFQRIINRFASFIYAATFTAVALFIITIITSTMSIRWLDYIFDVANNPTNDWRNWWDFIYNNPGQDVPATVLRTPVHPPPDWIDVEFIMSLQFPTFLPVTLLVIMFLILVYPILEAFYLAKRGSDAPSEIQAFWERNLIDRFRPPLNVFMSIVGMFLLYVLPVFLFYYIILYYGLVPTIFPEDFWFPLLAWFMVMPMLYLSYYSSFGVVTMFHESSRKVLSVFKRQHKLKGMKEMMDFAKFFIAIVLLISIIYGFFNILPILWGEIPDLREPGAGTTNEFIVQLIDLFIFIPEMQESFDTFLAILPFDLLIFILTSVGLALYGFYSKFLSKEPLNRPILVFFASYIIAAIGINVFLNVMIKYPQVYPSQLLFKFYEDPVAQAAYWEDMRSVFLVTQFANKTIMVIFVVYNMFFNKPLIKNIEEGVLNYAILNNRADILKRYTKSPEDDVRKRVAESTLDLVQERPKDVKQILKLLDDFGDDEDDEVLALANKGIRKFGRLYDDLEPLVPVIVRLINFEQDRVRNAIGASIAKIGRKYPEKFMKIVPSILTKPQTKEGLEILVSTMQDIGTEHPAIVGGVILPVLSLKGEQVRIGALGITKSILFGMKDQFDELFPKVLEATRDKNVQIRNEALDVLGLMAGMDESKVEPILQRLDELKAGTPDVKQRVIGALCNIVSTYPSRLPVILPKLFEFADDPDVEVRRDLAVALSFAGTFLAEPATFAKIEAIIFKLLDDADEQVRLNVAQAIFLLSQANPDLLESQTNYKTFIGRILKDASAEVRSRFRELAKFYGSTAPSYALFELFVEYMGEELPLAVQRDLFIILSDVIQNFPEELDIKMILDPVLEFPRDDDVVRGELVECLNEIAKVAPYEIPKFEQLLRELANDKVEEVQRVVVKTMGEIAQGFVKHPDKMPSSLSFQDYFNLLKAYILTMRGSALRETVVQLADLYEVHPTLYKEVFDTLLKVKDARDPVILAAMIRCLTDIVCEHKNEYAAKENLEGRLEWVHGTQFEKAFLPLLQSALHYKKKALRTEIARSLNRITEEFPQGSREIRDLLEEAIKSDDPEIKVVAVKVLGKFKDITTDRGLLKRLLKAAKNRKHTEIRAAALHSMENVLKQIHELAPEKREKHAVKRNLDAVARAIFTRRYRKDERTVREEYTETLGKLTRYFPSYEQAFSYLKEMAFDPTLKISLIAVKSFVKTVLANPDLVPKFYPFFQAFTRCKHRRSREVLVEGILAVQKLYPDNVEYVLPAILRLSQDADPMIRNKSFQNFDNLQQDHPDQIYHFTKLLHQMARHRKEQYRVDSIKLIVSVLKRHPEFYTEKNEIFVAFTDLARDPDKEVRYELAKWLNQAIPNFTDATVNYLLQMLLRLLREGDDDVRDEVVDGFRLVAKQFEYRVKDFLDDIERINKREQDPVIDRLVEDLEAIVKKKK